MTSQPATIPVMDALVIARVFSMIYRQIDTAWREGRGEDACSMARMIGMLRVRIAGWENYGSTPLDESYELEETDESAPKADPRDTDEAYEESVDEEMGCI
jgi:hypothetical protein